MVRGYPDRVQSAGDDRSEERGSEVSVTHSVENRLDVGCEEKIGS